MSPTDICLRQNEEWDRGSKNFEHVHGWLFWQDVLSALEAHIDPQNMYVGRHWKCKMLW